MDENQGYPWVPLFQETPKSIHSHGPWDLFRSSFNWNQLVSEDLFLTMVSQISPCMVLLLCIFLKYHFYVQISSSWTVWVRFTCPERVSGSHIRCHGRSTDAETERWHISYINASAYACKFAFMWHHVHTGNAFERAYAAQTFMYCGKVQYGTIVGM